jgi:hypothetical protein
VASLLPSSNAGPNSDQQVAVDAAIQDAAAHLGLGREVLRVERVEARQWADSSLGCPRPGVQYLQVVTSGFLIVVTDGTRTLEYHSDSRGRVVLCQES